MKIKILSLTLICSIILSFSLIEKPKFRPPGTVEIVENFFFDETERTNIDWREYLSFLKKNHGIDSEIYQNALPDTTVWRTADGNYNEPYVITYFQHPSYDNYPVVGISHQQAIDYCEWRTEAVKTMLKANDIKGPKDFKYRLPTQTEWELIAAGGFDKKAKKILMKGKRRAKIAEEKLEAGGEGANNGKYLSIYQEANMKYRSSDEKYEKYGFNNVHMTAPAHSYLPNKYGVYNIYGNVAEMVATEGIAVGGSYADYYEEVVHCNQELSYEAPTRWLGFRSVCEIIEE